jgi:putative hemolysin
VFPIYFEGRNSNLFQAAGLIHPLLRTVLLPRELLKKRSSSIKIRIGGPIPHRRLKGFEEIGDLRDYLRFRTYLLALSFREEKKLIPLPLRLDNRLRRMEKVKPQQDPHALEREVETLPREQKLIESNEYEVYFAASDQAPRVLQEIGRLREETFRMAGEGTGKAVDLDRFDNIYTHLFVWNRERNEVVGGYRLGATDEILARHGKKGLYTHTLFKYQDRFLEETGPALEMGRTFVRKEYQRSYSPLLLLWKGIGRYVVAHPWYRILFGAVSISNDYHSYSRRLLVAFLKMNRSLPDLGKMVTPRSPFRKKQVKGLHWVHEDGDEGLDELSAWISGIEEDGKGVPILLKQYLKLGGKVLSFNVDRKFRNALDGLILVDLALTDHKILKRYMGEEGFNAFMRYHRAQRLSALLGRS